VLGIKEATNGDNDATKAKIGQEHAKKLITTTHIHVGSSGAQMAPNWGKYKRIDWPGGSRERGRAAGNDDV
jgi:hypothetical protein